MAESVLHAVTVVLYESQDPINIGAVIRAMKNMGVRDLRLIRPCRYDLNRIEQIAHDTRDLVERIQHFDTIDDALADCAYVVGFSGRPQAARWQRHTPRSAAVDLLEYAQQGRVAIMFGREDHGLPNEALDRVHAICTIPTTEHFSLNVAQACLLALYELHLLAGDATKRLQAPRHAKGAPTKEAYEQAFTDMRNALDAIAYFKTRNEELIMRTMRSLVFRANPDGRELLMLRTASIEVLRTIERESRLAVQRALAEAGVAQSEVSTRASDAEAV
ncbi:MAG: RNA methyltransferase [Gemmatimonadaceae bacterium]|jgi:TrmH family RNA methyltransferase|nr:RNA methyltransferase [Gemmatimonadaceae bacterium]